MIRREEHFVWNFMLFLGTLAVGLSIGYLIGVVQPNSPLGAVGRIFVHLSGGHILGNIANLFLIGLVLAVFAHPLEFGAVIGSTLIVNTVFNLTFDIAGLSFVLFAMVGAGALYLIGVVTELGYFDGLGSQLLVAGTALVLLAVIGAQFQRQLLHDIGVVLFNQPVEFDPAYYTEKSSLAHFIGFCWGGLGAVGSRVLRYRITGDDEATGSVATGAQQDVFVCGGCGEEYDAERQFCTNCGSGAIHRR